MTARFWRSADNFRFFSCELISDLIFLVIHLSFLIFEGGKFDQILAICRKKWKLAEKLDFTARKTLYWVGKYLSSQSVLLEATWRMFELDVFPW